MNALDYAGIVIVSGEGRVLIARLLIKKGMMLIYPEGMPEGDPRVCLRANRRFAPRFLLLLLTHHAEPDVPDDDGRTPRCIASVENIATSSRILGCDDENDAEGTPEAACLQMLLERQVDGDRRDRSV